MTPDPGPAVDSIRAAARDLAGVTMVTPLLESPFVNAQTGARVLFKAECLQRTGSFKLRGAHTKLTRLPETQRRRGVVAFSAGNHAQALAYAARGAGVPATIVMPRDAPRIKIDNTRRFGAEVVLYDRASEDRIAIAESIAERSGAVLVPPFDDVDVIAGQGTLALEAAAQARALGAHVDAFLCPCGGGGLIAGSAIALAAESPATAVWAVEPEAADDTARSLRAGERLGNPPGAASICDALITERPGAITFAVNRRRLAGGLTVSDAEVIEAMAVLFERLKLVVEPGGAAGLAALRAGRFDARGKVVVVPLTGGNVDLARFAALYAGVGRGPPRNADEPG